jgi:pimeloyl-ACP methyl ester carboxylesterase
MLKLYIYNVMGWSEPTLGLFSARFVPLDKVTQIPADVGERVQKLPLGEVRYRQLKAGSLQANQSVALFVHGFQSETWGIVGEAETFLATRGWHYDHVLTFDYESFNTHIRDNGKKLAELMRAAGFGPNDEVTVDIFAHSMGTLVTRCMVELEGGHQFVDRCFLAGPPNAGTELARWKNFVTWLVTMLINKAGPNPPALVASWAVKRVSDDAIGPADLHPGAEVLKELGNAAAGGRRPYYVLAGANELTDEPKSLWQRATRMVFRGIDMAADFLFKSQNDLVIGVDSMRSLQGRYPQHLLKDKVVPCHHFAYFHASEPLAELDHWLREP